MLAILYVTLIAATGAAVLGLMARRCRLLGVEWIGLSLLVGAFAASFVLFVASLAGASVGLPSVLGLGLAAVCLTGLAWFRGGRPAIRVADISASVRKFRWWEFVLLALVIVPLAYLVHGHESVALADWDSWAIWDTKARFLVHEPLSTGEVYRDRSLSYVHPDYPLLLPFGIAGMHALTGAFDSSFATVVVPILICGAVAVVYDEANRSIGGGAALVILATFLWAPAVLRWGATAGADVPLACFFAAALCRFRRFASTGARDDLLVFAVLAAALVFTKNEGLALAGFLWIAVLVDARRRRRPLSIVLPGVVCGLFLSLPWIVFRGFLPKTHENYEARLEFGTVLENIDRLPDILAAFGSNVVDVGLWGGLFALLLISTLAVGWRIRSFAYWATWLICLGQLVLYVLIHVVTPWDVNELLQMTATRLLVHVSPAAIVLIVWHVEEWVEQGRRRGLEDRRRQALRPGDHGTPSG